MKSKKILIIFVLVMATAIVYLFAFTYFALNSLGDVDNNPNFIVDYVSSDRILILFLLVLQIIVFAVLRGKGRLMIMLIVCLGTIACYFHWLFSTFQMITSAENLSFGKIDHTMFLANGNLLDLLILGSVISTTCLIIVDLMKRKRLGT